MSPVSPRNFFLFILFCGSTSNDGNPLSMIIVSYKKGCWMPSLFRGNLNKTRNHVQKWSFIFCSYFFASFVVNDLNLFRCYSAATLTVTVCFRPNLKFGSFLFSPLRPYFVKGHSTSNAYGQVETCFDRSRESSDYGFLTLSISHRPSPFHGPLFFRRLDSPLLA